MSRSVSRVCLFVYLFTTCPFFCLYVLLPVLFFKTFLCSLHRSIIR